jgi:preprotein translocase subunit SecE
LRGDNPPAEGVATDRAAGWRVGGDFPLLPHYPPSSSLLSKSPIDILGGFCQDANKEVKMRKIIQFITECKSELKKVIWPSRDDVISSVKVVIISTIIIAGILGFVDFVLLLGVQKIF